MNDVAVDGDGKIPRAEPFASDEAALQGREEGSETCGGYGEEVSHGDLGWGARVGDVRG